MRFLTLLFLLLTAACNSTPADADRTLAAKQDALFRRDAKRVLTEVKEMVDADRYIRQMHDLGNLPPHVLDSFANIDFGGDMTASLAFETKHRPSDRFRDSIEKIMAQQDARHTARMVELTTRYGYPSSKRLGPDTKIDPFLIFHHPSDRYKDTVMALLTRELHLGRIDTQAFRLIKWSYNGRQGFPEGMKAAKIDTLPDGTKAISVEWE